jgi:hypothetical protein
MIESTESTIVAEVSTPNPLAVFGNGRHSNLGKECYHDLQKVFGIEPDHAQKIALQIMKDWGAYMATSTIGISSVSIGKVSKDNKVTLREAGSKVKGATVTYALQILRALTYCVCAADYGFAIYTTKWSVKADTKLADALDYFK